MRANNTDEIASMSIFIIMSIIIMIMAIFVMAIIKDKPDTFFEKKIKYLITIGDTVYETDRWVIYKNGTLDFNDELGNQVISHDFKIKEVNNN